MLSFNLKFNGLNSILGTKDGTQFVKFKDGEAIQFTNPDMY
jgi:hypothetical protein